MPTGLAILGGSAISAAVAGGAADKASSAATGAANTNNALLSSIYAQNQSALSPYISRGNAAGDTLQSLLGLPAGQSTASTNGGYDQYLAANPDIAAEARRVTADGEFPSVQAYLQWHDANYGGENRASYTNPAASSTGSTANGQSGLDSYLNSVNYNFTRNQGIDAVQQSAAARGLLKSGSTLKGLNNYGQNTAQTYLQQYIGNLQSQQGAGLSGASALAGVGQNYGAGVSANNNSAASAVGNSALASASNTNSAIDSALSAYGQYQGLSSYKTPTSSMGDITSAYGGGAF